MLDEHAPFCPVCGLSSSALGRTDDPPSWLHMICPCCFVHFEVEDWDYAWEKGEVYALEHGHAHDAALERVWYLEFYALARLRWLREGCPWRAGPEHEPPLWNPRAQLGNIGVSVPDPFWAEVLEARARYQADLNDPLRQTWNLERDPQKIQEALFDLIGFLKTSGWLVLLETRMRWVLQEVIAAHRADGEDASAIRELEAMDNPDDLCRMLELYLGLEQEEVLSHVLQCVEMLREPRHFRGRVELMVSLVQREKQEGKPPSGLPWRGVLRGLLG